MAASLQNDLMIILWIVYGSPGTQHCALGSLWTVQTFMCPPKGNC